VNHFRASLRLAAAAGLSIGSTSLAQTWDETVSGGGDAGSLPASAQVCAGSGPVTTITGVNAPSDADVYAILITSPSTFSASTTVVTTWDTMLWLFDAQGYGVTANDDTDNGYQSRITGQFLFSAGLYYLAVSKYYNAPTDSYPIAIWFTYSPEARPDGGGQLYPVAGWEGGQGGAGAYQISLTGAALVPAGPPGACCLSDGSCSFVSAGACAALGGVHQGGGIACAAANCVQPPGGACCLPDLTCVAMSQTLCTFRGGVYQGTGTACATAGCTLGWVEREDAGNLPAAAQAPIGQGTLPGISGTLLDIFDADMYRIRICDRASFSATTINTATTFDDTQLFLFDPTGRGVTFNDDDPSLTGYRSTLTPQFVPASGEYYIAISSWDEDPLGGITGEEIWLDFPTFEERQPDGPAAAEAPASWNAGGYYAGRYLILFTGVCFPAGACYPNCDNSTTAPVLNVQDFTCFLQRYAAGDSFANCDNSTVPPVLNVQDFTCFLQSYAAGCN
jgi:hypothetical protein